MNAPRPQRPTGYVPSKILLPKVKDPLHLIGLCNSYYGLWTHWVGRSYYCSRHWGNCRLCKDKEPRKWRGYLPCSAGITNGRFVVMITENVAEQLDLRTKQQDWIRGRRIQFGRFGERKNAPMTFSVGEPVSGKFPLMKPFNPAYQALLSLGFDWGEAAEIVEAGKDVFWDDKP